MSKIKIAELFECYPTFNKNTLTYFNKKNYRITKKFISIHPEFLNHLNKRFEDIGLTRILRKK